MQIGLGLLPIGSTSSRRHRMRRFLGPQPPDREVGGLVLTPNLAEHPVLYALSMEAFACGVGACTRLLPTKSDPYTREPIYPRKNK